VFRIDHDEKFNTRQTHCSISPSGTVVGLQMRYDSGLRGRRTIWRWDQSERGRAGLTPDQTFQAGLLLRKMT